VILQELARIYYTVIANIMHNTGPESIPENVMKPALSLPVKDVKR